MKLRQNVGNLKAQTYIDACLLTHVSRVHLVENMSKSFKNLTGDQREPLDSVEVGVLDGHDALVGEQLLGVVVDQLSVDEHVDVVLADLVNLDEEKQIEIIT